MIETLAIGATVLSIWMGGCTLPFYSDRSFDSTPQEVWIPESLTHRFKEGLQPGVCTAKIALVEESEHRHVSPQS